MWNRLGMGVRAASSLAAGRPAGRVLVTQARVFSPLCWLLRVVALEGVLFFFTLQKKNFEAREVNSSAPGS